MAMDFNEQVRTLAALIPKLRDQLKTEEATKLSLVQPFIKILGYDLFNPTEVVPEFDAAIGVKQGEKIDYAILRENCPIMLVECKWSGRELDLKDEDQLKRYFGACTSVRIGVLTNGLKYQFFTDTDQPNVMDKWPFFEFDMLNFSDAALQDLRRFTKTMFDAEAMPDVAIQLKYLKGIKERIHREFGAPSEEFIKFIAGQLYEGKKVTQKVVELFTTLTQAALKQYMDERIEEILKDAKDSIAKKGEEKPSTGAGSPQIPAEGVQEPSDAEKEGFYIIRTLIYPIVGPERIYWRKKKGKNYLNAVLDDSQKKPICRLYLHSEAKAIGLWEETGDGKGRQEKKETIEGLNDLYGYAERLKEIVSYHLAPKTPHNSKDEMTGDSGGAE